MCQKLGGNDRPNEFLNVIEAANSQICWNLKIMPGGPPVLQKTEKSASHHSSTLARRFNLPSAPEQAQSVAHALQASTALGPNLTILSKDGVGAFDSISRASMLDALSRLPTASSALNFVNCFHGCRSHFLQTDDESTTHSGRRAGLEAHSCRLHRTAFLTCQLANAFACR